jgi:Xaa-Pro dipeptidase
LSCLMGNYHEQFLGEHKGGDALCLPDVRHEGVHDVLPLDHFPVEFHEPLQQIDGAIIEMSSVLISDLDRGLLEAQNKARQLLKQIEERKLLKIGSTEREVTDQIYDLALDLYGTKKHWHKRIVRTGANSVLTFQVNPPDLTLQKNDLVYLDLGPVFDEFEGDIGKTYLLGSDLQKAKLLEDLERIWGEAKVYYLKRPSMTGAELWARVIELTQESGWSYGSHIAGHIMGEFSHKQNYGDLPEHRINELNHVPMDSPGQDETKRNWILELHMVHPDQEYGAFFEDLLSL